MEEKFSREEYLLKRIAYNVREINKHVKSYAYWTKVDMSRIHDKCKARYEFGCMLSEAVKSKPKDNSYYRWMSEEYAEAIKAQKEILDWAAAHPSPYSKRLAKKIETRMNKIDPRFFEIVK